MILYSASFFEADSMRCAPGNPHQKCFLSQADVCAWSIMRTALNAADELRDLLPRHPISS